MALTEQQKQEIKEQQSHQNTTKRVRKFFTKPFLFWIMDLLELLIIWEMTVQLFKQLEFHMEKEPKKFLLMKD